VTQELEDEAPAVLPTDTQGEPIAVLARSLGAQLRQAREANGNSIADVVQVIRFSAHQIEALERDDYASLPGATSARGLVRNYCKFLKLDPVPLLALLEPAVPVPEADVRPPANMGEAEQPSIAERVPSRLLSVAFGILVLIAAAFWYLDTDGEHAPAKQATPPVTNVPQPSAPPGDAGSAVAVMTPTATVVGGNVAASPTELPVMPAPGGLRVEFDDRSWIEIRDVTQKVILVGEYGAGARHNVEGKPPFQIWIGKASGVRLFMGERSIDLKPHTREEVARFTLE
jgi:cytoskeleton protein RodZ